MENDILRSDDARTGKRKKAGAGGHQARAVGRRVTRQSREVSRDQLATRAQIYLAFDRQGTDGIVALGRT